MNIDKAIFICIIALIVCLFTLAYVFASVWLAFVAGVATIVFKPFLEIDSTYKPIPQPQPSTILQDLAKDNYISKNIEELAVILGRTERSVKVLLCNNWLDCKDYSGRKAMERAKEFSKEHNSYTNTLLREQNELLEENNRLLRDRELYF